VDVPFGTIQAEVIRCLAIGRFKKSYIQILIQKVRPRGTSWYKKCHFFCAHAEIVFFNLIEINHLCDMIASGIEIAYYIH